MATTLSNSLQTLSLQTLSLQTLPDDIQQRVLAGIPLDDHQATASACKAFRAVIRGPNFLALRRRYGFSERGVVVVENTAAPAMSLKIITSGITTNLFEGIRGGSPVTTDGGSRLCVHNGRIIVFLANGHGGGTLVRAADGSWAPYEGVGDSAKAEALEDEGNELIKKGNLKGANAKYSEALDALADREPAAGWGPRNNFSFASAPAGASKHGVSASVVLG